MVDSGEGGGTAKFCPVSSCISWTDLVRNEVLHTLKEEGNILHTTQKGKIEVMRR
jgi:hypothetical protein